MLEVVDGHHVSRPRGVDALTAMQDQGKRERGTVAWRQNQAPPSIQPQQPHTHWRTRPELGRVRHFILRGLRDQSRPASPVSATFKAFSTSLRNEEPLSIYFAQNRGFFGTFRNLSANGSKGKNRPKSLVPSPPAGAFRSCHNSPRTLLLLRLR
jgi:hypothetical protein